VKIYTKTGDRGETGLLGPLRVSKSDPRIAAYGEVDELNAALGVVRAEIASASGARSPRTRTTEAATQAARPPDPTIDRVLERIQSDLFVVGAMLATQPGVRLAVTPIVGGHVARLERAIDAAIVKLPPLASFILPGGTPVAAQLHLARTICRRAERAIARKEDVAPNVIIYVNRLSDLLFVLARLANATAGVRDMPWVAPKSRKR
jgi:cob(I)alamin adenosyltransferase